MMSGEGNTQQAGGQAQGAVMTVAVVDHPWLALDDRGFTVNDPGLTVVAITMVELYSHTLHGVDAAVERIQQAVDMPCVTVGVSSPMTALGAVNDSMHMVCQAVEIFQVSADMAQ